jgi:hypothetical protein
MIHQVLTHLALLQQTGSNPYVWALEHVSAIGWPALIIFAWRVATYFERLSTKAKNTIGQIDTLATNHFPHMQESLQKQDGLLQTMNESLKTIAQNSHRRREDF